MPVGTDSLGSIGAPPTNAGTAVAGNRLVGMHKTAQGYEDTEMTDKTWIRHQDLKTQKGEETHRDTGEGEIYRKRGTSKMRVEQEQIRRKGGAEAQREREKVMQCIREKKRQED